MNKIKNCIFIMSLILLLSGCGEQEELLIYQQTEEMSEESTTEAAVISENSMSESVPEEKDLFVHVCGAVQTPGVYEVASGSRIYEVINLAGGLLETADSDYLNQAETVSDGLKLYVPTREEIEAGMVKNTNEEKADTSASTGLVNINTADVSLLTTIRGVGESRAESIIAYREENGGFSSIEDIMKVTGIKEGLFNKIKDQITVGVN